MVITPCHWFLKPNQQTAWNPTTKESDLFQASCKTVKFKMISQTKQCSEYSVLKFAIFVILTMDSSQALVNQDNTVSDSGPSLFFYQDRIYPRDCKEIQDQCSTQNSTGAHHILPDGYHEPFWVYCSEEWTVIQRRFDGIIDFNRSWTDYRNGFGYLSVDHWLGNERLSYLTNQKVYELRIEFETNSGLKAHISYDGFRINDEFSDYSLTNLGQRSGTEAYIQCPTNMVYGNCSRCIATCADPSATLDCSNDCNDFPRTCVCPANYLMNETKCVRQEQCGCYKEGYGVIADDATYVTSDCSERCTCISGTLTCVTSPCAQTATCKVADGVRDCICNEGYEGDGRTCTESTFQDCYDISLRRSGSTASGDYTISPPGWTGGDFTVNCNMTIDGGGWTVIQRHFISSSRQDFNQNWEMYKNGFGNPSGEFWIGNEKLFTLTNQREYELRIDMVRHGTHQQYYAKYDFFRIRGESEKYQLSGLGSFTGTTGYDAMRAPGTSSYNLENMYFSTPDRDNDRSSANCAAVVDGGWWYNACHAFTPNYGNAYCSQCVGSLRFPDSEYVKLAYSEMKIRPNVATQ